MNPLIIGYIFLGLVLLILGVLFLKRLTVRRSILRLLRLRLLSVRLPQKFESVEKKEALAEINFSSQLFGILANLKLPFAMEAAVHNVGEDIHFYLAVPEESVQFVMRQIQGFWNDAQVERAEDYTVFNPQGAADGVFLKQKSSYALPIKTYGEAGIDTFSPILSNFSKLESAGEGMAIQVLVRPAPVSVKKTVSDFIYRLRKGGRLSDILERKFTLPPLIGETKKEEKEIKVIDEESVKLLEQKISKPIFSVNFRLIASAATPDRVQMLLDGLAGSFSQFSAPLRNELGIVRPRNMRKFLFKFVFREFDDGKTITLNADELASLFHFPTATTEVPKIKWVKAKEAPPPTNLSAKGVLIGESVFRGESKSVFISDDDRRRHAYIIGQTGTGKSNLLINMAVSDIENGKGAAVIDPHGDLIDSILTLMPKNRHKDVIIFDPGDINRPLGLNMLECDPNRPEQKTFIVNEMQSIFNKLFVAETMGPMFEQYMRNALLLLMDDPEENFTLIEVPRVFTDSEFRRRLLQKAKNPTVADFWEKEAIKAGGEASLANMTPYITSKFNNFIANDYVRPIIGQPKSAFNFRAVMDEGKILLVNLSKGRIGDINAGLLGMIVVGKLLMSALSRVDIPQEKRRDFNLYIDEFQNFTTDSIATILSEARKYRLNLVMAHQFIAQLAEKIRDAVFGNVGSIIAFRVGPDDAEFLVKEFEPIFSKNDLINIDNFNAYVKLLISGQTSKSFNIRTLAARTGDIKAREELKERSQQTYGRSREEVEIDILKRLRT